jgi:tetratricopeptide (TPR) repeat protein
VVLVHDLATLLQSAINEQRRGETLSAVDKFQQVSAARPEQWDVLYLQGTALLQLGRHVEAIETFEKVVGLRPQLADAHNNIGVAYQALGDFERAACAFETAVGLPGEIERACLNFGRLKEQLGLFAEAEALYRRATQIKPTERIYWLHLAGALGKQNKWSEAEVVLRQAVESDRNNLDLSINLAYALIQREQLDSAADVYLHVLARRPDYHEVHANLAFIRERQGRLDEALSSAQRAIELKPDYAEGYNNLGTILRSMHRLDGAVRAFEKAAELNPTLALAEFNLGTAHLLAGDYEQGWAGYRQYTRVGESSPFDSNLPEWDGRPIPGKRLLVYADQGFGDTIQFARFLVGCRRQSAARIVFCCQASLAGLFAGWSGVDELLVTGSQIPPCDLQVPLACLPSLLGIRIETAAAGMPYLHSRGELRSEIASMLRQGPVDALRIGLVWQGNPAQRRDVVRSCPLRKLLPLLGTPGSVFFSLQTGEHGRAQISELGLAERLVDVGKALSDFSETAAALSALDLIITVDTATAHLAGALGRPVWTMLCHTPDWRWHLDRADSPWYPTMRLFRQPKWGDWESVVREIQTCLMRGPSLEKKIVV